jgi:tRNA pseudouridine38-40 synthase
MDDGAVSKRLRLDIEYDGTRFAGWQVQPGKRTIQGEITHALGTLLRVPIKVVGAGRTDAGVHARGQVAHIDVPDDGYPLHRLLSGVNALTGADVVVRDITLVPDTFHARFSAIERSYTYRIARSPVAIDRNIAWTFCRSLDTDIMATEAQDLIGRYPATVWCSARAKDTEAVVHVRRAALDVSDGRILFTISADRFVMHMVRSIVGTLVDVGRGRFGSGTVRRLIEGADRSAVGETAPACGLCLQRVEYEADVTSSE